MNYNNLNQNSTTTFSTQYARKGNKSVYEDIKYLSDNMKSIMEVTDLMAEYNSSLLIMQIGEQLDEFKNRVTLLVTALQMASNRSNNPRTNESISPTKVSRRKLQCSSNKVIRLLSNGDHIC
jgi:hypothetical protein